MNKDNHFLNAQERAFLKKNWSKIAGIISVGFIVAVGAASIIGPMLHKDPVYYPPQPMPSAQVQTPTPTPVNVEQPAAPLNN